MIYKDKKELMTLMREQQRMASNKEVDFAISQARHIATGPRVAYEEWKEAELKVQQLKSRAEGIYGMSPMQDRVTGGTPTMMDDQVMAVLAAKEEAYYLKQTYYAARSGFLHCLDRAMRVSGFSDYQCAIWKLYYTGEERSLQQIADLMRTTKSRVQYLLTSVKAQAKWCKAIEYIIENEIELED